MTYEVFRYTRPGAPVVVVVRGEWLARLACWIGDRFGVALDYARPGEGF